MLVAKGRGAVLLHGIDNIKIKDSNLVGSYA
jgi:hypothetical protein